jgi:hypothetical protein
VWLRVREKSVLQGKINMANTNTASIGYYNLTAWPCGTGTSPQKVLWNGGSTPVFTSGTTPLSISLDSDISSGGTWDNRPFRVHAVGLAQVRVTATVTIGVYNDAVTTANLVSTSLVGALSASTSVTGATTAYVPFEYEALLMWNSTTLEIGGVFKGFTGGSSAATTVATVRTAETAAYPSSTGLTTAATGPAAFSLGITYSASQTTPSNVIVSEFSIERV